MQHDDDHRLQCCRPFYRQIDRLRRFRLDPVAETAQRAVSGQRGPDGTSKGIKQRITPAWITTSSSALCS